MRASIDGNEPKKTGHAVLLSVASTLVLAACAGFPGRDGDDDEMRPPAAAPTPATEADQQPPSPEADQVVAYRRLVDMTMSELNELTRLLGALSLDVSRARKGAAQERQLLLATTDTFRLVQNRLDATAPPPRYEKLHMHLEEAVAAYIQAAETLDVDPATGKLDYRLFQELMVQGGKNVHAVAAELSAL